MLTALFEALVQQLSPLACPVYLADCVPQDAAFPRIAADLSPAPGPGQDGLVRLTAWTGSTNAGRFALADALLTLLPPQGLCLSTAAGRALLFCDGQAECIREHDALGIRLTWRVRFYPSA